VVVIPTAQVYDDIDRFPVDPFVDAAAAESPRSGIRLGDVPPGTGLGVSDRWRKPTVRFLG
jgi:hypothetical protein